MYAYSKKYCDFHRFLLIWRSQKLHTFGKGGSQGGSRKGGFTGGSRKGGFTGGFTKRGVHVNPPWLRACLHPAPITTFSSQSYVGFPLSSSLSWGQDYKEKHKTRLKTKGLTYRAKQYKVTSFLSTDCELSTNPCSKNVDNLGPWAHDYKEKHKLDSKLISDSAFRNLVTHLSFLFIEHRL